MNISGVGLAFDTVGALLLVFFPPDVRRFTKEGSERGDWINAATPAGKRRALFQRGLSVAAFLMLAVGFSLQLYGSRATAIATRAAEYLHCTFSTADHQVVEQGFTFSPNDGTLTDEAGHLWRTVRNTPISLISEHDRTFDNESLGSTEQVAIDRISGSAQFNLLERPIQNGSAPIGPDTPVEIRDSSESGECRLTNHLAIP
jgi:hypothetical protein